MKKSNLNCLSLSSKTNLIMKRIVLILSLFVFAETTATKSVWECFQQDGSLCSELEVYGPDNWVNNDSDSYEIGGDDFPVTFNGTDEMQTPFGDGDILQTWSRVD